MTLLEIAQETAKMAHDGQTDKGGLPYIGHPLRVMAMGRDYNERIVGVLHDVVEDTDVTFEELAGKGFGEEIIEALRCVTKTSPDEDYEEFIERCASNPLATAVKIHDLTDNMDVRRLKIITDNDVDHLRKYLKAYQRLLPLYEQSDRKKIVYIDMDGVLVDFKSALNTVDEKTLAEYAGRYDDIPHLFSRMKPMPGAIESFSAIASRYDTYILSTSPWNNPTALQDKKDWVVKYLGDAAWKRIIFSHHKDLNRGDYLIDDRTLKGAGEFQGKLLLFGSEQFPDWKSVTKYLCPVC